MDHPFSSEIEISKVVLDKCYPHNSINRLKNLLRVLLNIPEEDGAWEHRFFRKILHFYTFNCEYQGFILKYQQIIQKDYGFVCEFFKYH